jgi:hypothetical protein
VEEDSSDGSIPEEHDPDQSEEEYLKQYKCIIKSITWHRDSHGLFDYEMKHPDKY